MTTSVTVLITTSRRWISWISWWRRWRESGMAEAATANAAVETMLSFMIES